MSRWNYTPDINLNNVFSKLLTITKLLPEIDVCERSQIY